MSSQPTGIFRGEKANYPFVNYFNLKKFYSQNFLENNNKKYINNFMRELVLSEYMSYSPFKGIFLSSPLMHKNYLKFIVWNELVELDIYIQRHALKK